MTPSNNDQFKHYYTLHCKHLELKGMQPKTIETYTRTLRRIGAFFEKAATLTLIFSCLQKSYLHSKR